MSNIIEIYNKNYVTYPLLTKYKESESIAKSIVKQLLLDYPTIDKFILVGTGTSGLFLCTILLSILKDKADIIYIRKEKDHENSHGSKIEYSYDINFRNPNNIFVFVDDAIETGTTYNKVVKSITYFHNIDIIVLFKNFGNGRRYIKEHITDIPIYIAVSI